MLVQLEQAGEGLWKSGWRDKWFARSDLETRNVTREANGHLFLELARATGFADLDGVELLRKGASMIEELECSGMGTPLPQGLHKPAEMLRQTCRASNRALLAELREDPKAEELLRVTCEDAEKGRMSAPAPVDMQKLEHVRLNPRYGHSCACAMFWRGPCGVACRFAVEQEKPDGAMKTRPIDDLSWSAAALFDGEEARPSKKARKEASVNGFTLPVCEHA